MQAGDSWGQGCSWAHHTASSRRAPNAETLHDSVCPQGLSTPAQRGCGAKAFGWFCFAWMPFVGPCASTQEGPTSAVELVGRQQQGASTKAGLVSLWDLRYFSRCCCLALPLLKTEKQPTCCSSSPLKWWRADGEAPCLGQCTLSHLRQFCAYRLGLCDQV